MSQKFVESHDDKNFAKTKKKNSSKNQSFLFLRNVTKIKITQSYKKKIFVRHLSLVFIKLINPK